MGYTTTFDGVINLGECSKQRQKLLKKRMEQMGMSNDNFSSWDTFEMNVDKNKNVEMIVCMEMKNYFSFSKALFHGFDEMPGDNSMLEIFQRLAPLFPNDAEGEIFCNGEETEDMWKIIVRGQTVFIEEARIEFERTETHEPPEEALTVAEQLLLRGGKL